MGRCKKKILIFAHYYVPDVAATGQILKELAEGILDKFEVTVICVVPSYDGKVSAEYKKNKYYYETMNGVRIIRVRVPGFSKDNKFSRIKNLIVYFGRAIHAAKKEAKQDYVLSISQPPILGGVLGYIGKKIHKAKYIYNIQDFNPEQTIAVGYVKNKLVLNITLLLDKFSCRKSDVIITEGRDLVETVRKRFNYKNVPKTVMISNWINEKEIYPLPADDKFVQSFKEQYRLKNNFVFMYSGNLGLYYDLENLIKIVAKFKGATTQDGRVVKFVFVGAGSVLEKLEYYVKENKLENVLFIPYQKKENLIYSMNAADVHWCVNAKGIKGVSVPSKYYGISAVGKPVLGVQEEETEIRYVMEENKGGLVCNPSEYSNIESNIKWFIDNANTLEFKEMGLRGRQYLVENLSMEKSINKYKTEILNL